MNRFIKQTAIAICVLALSGAGVAVGADGSAMLDQLRAAGRKTLERLGTEPASWTAVHQFLDSQLTVEVVCHGARQRWELYEGSAREKKSIGRIIVRDGRWYVDCDGLPPSIYKPCQAPLADGQRYTALYRSQLRGIDEYATPGATLVSGKGPLATLRSPLPETLRAALTEGLKEAESAQTGPAGAKQRSDPAQIRRLLADGVSITVHVDTGIVSSWSRPRESLQIQDFRWLPEPPEDAFDIDGAQWEDRTGDLAERLPNLLALMFHRSPEHSQERNIRFGDLMLVNVKTGKERRVPYHLGPAMSGCFSKDRDKVYVSGLDPITDRMKLVEVDLQTGRNRAIADDALSSGSVINPVLSPDGTKLAAFLVKGGSGNEPRQVCVIDLETQRVSPIGKPGYFESMSWLPASSGLILVRIVADKDRKGNAHRVCRLDLKGQLVPLIAGGSAQVIGEANRIIFNELSEGRMIWKTCDLDGADVQTIGKGLANLRFPAPSPDGGKAIMFYPAPGTDGIPVMVDLKSGTVSPLSLSPGKWSMPCWQ